MTLFIPSAAAYDGGGDDAVAGRDPACVEWGINPPTAKADPVTCAKILLGIVNKVVGRE